MQLKFSITTLRFTGAETSEEFYQMKKLSKLVIILAQLGLVSVAQAASISLSPASQNAVVEGTLSYQVNVDFSDVATDGGSFRISYDSSLLGDADFSYAALSSPITGTWAPVYSAGLIESVGFDANAFQGSVVLGTLSFTVLGAGNTTVTLSDMLNSNLRFLDSDQWDPIVVDYSGATANLTAVPVPAALWLMASGLSVLGLGMRRRRA